MSPPTALEATIDNINTNLRLIMEYINKNNSPDIIDPLTINVKSLQDIVDEQEAKRNNENIEEAKLKGNGEPMSEADKKAVRDAEGMAAGRAAAIAEVAADAAARERAAAKEAEARGAEARGAVQQKGRWRWPLGGTKRRSSKRKTTRRRRRR